MYTSIGCDLEYAVVNKKGAVVPAGVLDTEGIKGNPEPLTHGGIEIDCCALETTPQYSYTEDGFVSNILNLLDEVKNKYNQYRFITKPSHTFTRSVIQKTRMADVMGCSPDFNAWTGQMNPRPMVRNGFRSFGGHIHIGEGTPTTIKACDLILGMWSVLEDSDTKRRELYGKAGAFRSKPYGVEYRVLSNFWCDNEGLIRQVFRLTREAQSLSMDQVDLIANNFGGPDVIQHVINSGDKETAKTILDFARVFTRDNLLKAA